MAHGLTLRHVPSELRARTDAALMDRILRNLIENALRYTEKGGILVGLRRHGDKVRLDVIDTGIGIPADKQTEIFEEFRQLDNPARDASRGLGLGLAIVSRLAHLLSAAGGSGLKSWPRHALFAAATARPVRGSPPGPRRRLKEAADASSSSRTTPSYAKLMR